MNFDDIFLELKIDGYSVIYQNAIEKDLFNKLKSIHEEILNNNSDFNNKEYLGGSVVVWNKNLESRSKVNNEPLNKFLNSNIVKSITSREDYKEYRFTSAYATLDRPKTKHIAQSPHFDRIPTLKFLLYLNDMDKDNGAFMLSRSSNNWVKNKFGIPRPSFMSKDYLNETRNPPQLLLNRLKPIEGEAGTLIIFDTDTIHHQGLVKKGESRILRFHFNSSCKLNEYHNLRERLGTYKQKLNSLFSN